jgi:hypothetical protein
MSKFLSELCLKDNGDDHTWTLLSDLVYQSDLLDCTVTIPKGFITDLASVPRVPFIWESWGNRAHYEAVVHDYLYCLGAVPDVTYRQANRVFLEAMEVRGKSIWIRWPMFWGVCLGGWTSWKKRNIKDRMVE